MTPDDLRLWREALNLTQEDAASMLGFKSRPHYAALETGKKPLPFLLPMACAAHYHRVKPWPEGR